MKQMTRLSVEELREIMPVLDDEAQRKVYGGCGDYGSGTTIGNDCLYLVLSSFGGSASTVQESYAKFLMDKGYSNSDADKISLMGVRSSDMNEFMEQYGFTNGYSLSSDGEPSCGKYGVAVVKWTDSSGETCGHAYRINKRMGDLIICQDIATGEVLYIQEDDPRISSLYTKS